MAGNKYLSIDGTTGDLKEVASDNTAATANAVVALDASGTVTPVQMPGGAPVNTSAGAGDAGKLPKLDAAGKLDMTMMPTGVGSEALSVVVGTSVTAGDFVHIYNDTGLKCRPADNSTYRAHGYVLASVTANGSNTATVYFEGTNTQLSSLTPGTEYYLGANGDPVTYASLTKTSGYLNQKIGVATSATSISFEASRPVIFA